MCILKNLDQKSVNACARQIRMLELSNKQSVIINNVQFFFLFSFSFLSMVDYYKRYQDNHQRMTSLYNKWNNTSSSSLYSTTTSTTTTSSSSFEVLFSKLLDALIFTSAIVITAYSYLTGTLVEPVVPTIITSSSSSPPITYLHSPKQIRYESSSSRYDDHKRRRTQEWAEQQLLTTPIFVKRRSCSTLKVHFLSIFHMHLIIIFLRLR